MVSLRADADLLVLTSCWAARLELSPFTTPCLLLKPQGPPFGIPSDFLLLYFFEVFRFPRLRGELFLALFSVRFLIQFFSFQSSLYVNVG